MRSLLMSYVFSEHLWNQSKGILHTEKKRLEDLFSDWHDPIAEIIRNTTREQVIRSDAIAFDNVPAGNELKR